MKSYYILKEVPLDPELPINERIIFKSVALDKSDRGDLSNLSSYIIYKVFVTDKIAKRYEDNEDEEDQFEAMLEILKAPIRVLVESWSKGESK